MDYAQIMTKDKRITVDIDNTAPVRCAIAVMMIWLRSSLGKGDEEEDLRVSKAKLSDYYY